MQSKALNQGHSHAPLPPFPPLPPLPPLLIRPPTECPSPFIAFLPPRTRQSLPPSPPPPPPPLTPLLRMTGAERTASREAVERYKKAGGQGRGKRGQAAREAVKPCGQGGGHDQAKGRRARCGQAAQCRTQDSSKDTVGTPRTLLCLHQGSPL